jgi:uncharacterized protein
MLILQIKVKPNSRTSSLIQLVDGTWLAQLKSPPIDGITLIVKQLDCPRKVISINVRLAS